MTMPTAAEKYSQAIELYRTTEMSVTEISRQCGLPRSGLASYIQRHHRELMQARAGITGNPEKRLHASNGQRPATAAKYSKAITACRSNKYLQLSISQIAHKYKLNPTALGNQLRAHFPEILSQREAARQALGIDVTIHRGATQTAKDTYADAIKLLKDSSVTIAEAAAKCNVSASGLKQHILYYHKELAQQRVKRRQHAKGQKKIGEISGNGQIHSMSAESAAKYAEAVELYRTTAMAVKEIAAHTGVSASGLRRHLETWHRKLIFERRGVALTDNAPDNLPLSYTKRYKRDTQQKYADAISVLKSTSMTTEAVAKQFGFIPEVFRAYIKEHEPTLFEANGMIKLPSGKTVLKRTYEKYKAAVDDYAASGEPLKTIAERHGVNYKSLDGFIRRNFHELL